MSTNRGVYGRIRYQATQQARDRWLVSFSRPLGGATVSFTELDVLAQPLGTGTPSVAVVEHSVEIPRSPAARSLVCRQDVVVVGGRSYELSTQPAGGDRTCFSWVHLSDIHFRVPGKRAPGREAADREIVLRYILEDISSTSAKEGIRPDVVLVTGDVAFSGKKEEYQLASTWFSKLATRMALPSAQFHFVAGNHDVDRSVHEADHDVENLVDLLRGERSSLDNQLHEPVQRSRLRRRVDNFAAFASAFPGMKSSLELVPDVDPAFFWTSIHRGQHGARVRFLGLNTALLAKDERDAGKLQLGGWAQKYALDAIDSDKTDGDALVIAMGHHPLDAGWLRDQDRVLPWVREEVDVCLSGHEHRQNAGTTRKAGHKSTLFITSGAAHATDVDHFRYSIASVIADAAGDLKLRIWPRVWTAREPRFLQDTALCDPGKTYGELPLDRPVR